MRADSIWAQTSAGCGGMAPPPGTRRLRHVAVPAVRSVGLICWQQAGIHHPPVPLRPSASRHLSSGQERFNVKSWLMRRDNLTRRAVQAPLHLLSI